ncbi:mitochondrial carrier protein Leu5p [Diutina catenulata]
MTTAGVLRSKTSQVNDQSTPLEHVKIIDKQSVEYVVRSGIAGGLAGSAAKTLIAPFDRVKILFQTSNPEFIKYRGSFSGFFRATGAIIRADGVAGLFQGHSVTLLRIFPYAAIKFVAYEQIRAVLIPGDAYETSVRRFMAGSLSGLASVCCTYPLDLVRVRMAFETRNLNHLHPDHKEYMDQSRGRLRKTITAIYHENPPSRPSDPSWVRLMRRVLPHRLLHVSNFYRGFYPTILGMIPYAGVSFYTHDAIHDVFRSKLFAPYTVQRPSEALEKKKERLAKEGRGASTRDVRPPLRAYAQLIAGGLAGMCSQTAAYPFEVIRRRMQVGGVMNRGEFLSFKDTAKLIYKESGVRGFFVGLSIGYMKVIPMVSCSFFVYERTKAWLLK